jgi:hypothetical protein
MNEDYDTDEMLDRLIDGELSPDDRRRVLVALETSVDGWRRCALGFVEAQTWRGEMRQLVGDGGNVVQVDSPPVGQSLRDCQNQLPERLVNQHDNNRHGLSWLAMAAGLMFAFALGWRVHAPQGAPGFDQPLAMAPPLETPANRPAAGDDAVTLVLNDSQGAQHRVEVPLVEARNLGGGFAEAPGWAPSSALRRTLDAQGVNLKTRRRYAPLYFEQQNQIVPMVVPVDDAYVTPVNSTVF